MFYSALIAINNDKDIFGQTELCISSARTALLNVFILKSVDEIFWSIKMLHAAGVFRSSLTWDKQR